MKREAGLPAPAHKTFIVPTWVLALIQTFTIWQMGVIYYSSPSLTVSGLTPLPAAVDSVVLPIALGYVAGAVLAGLFPQRVGLWGKLIAGCALCCILLLFAPLPPAMRAALYCAEVFLCVAFIGVGETLAIDVYALPVALKDGIVGTVVAAPFIALLHFSSFSLSFAAFNLFSALIQILLLIGLTRIPNHLPLAFTPRRQTPPPLLLVSGTVLVYTVICCCFLFSSTAAASVTNGVPLFYLSGLLWAALFIWLHYGKNINPFHLYAVFLGISAFGFILWLLPLPTLRPFCLFLESAVVVLSNLAMFTMGVLFEKYSSRRIAPAAIIIALLTALFNSALISLLRHNSELLYALYAVIALGLLIIYLLTAPYLRRVWIDADAPPDSPAEPLPAAADPPTQALTKRELEVLPLITQGYDNATIARLLFISEHTVKSHVKNIFRKLGVHSRFELAAKINRQEERPASAQ